MISSIPFQLWCLTPCFGITLPALVSKMFARKNATGVKRAMRRLSYGTSTVKEHNADVDFLECQCSSSGCTTCGGRRRAKSGRSKGRCVAAFVDAAGAAVGAAGAAAAAADTPTHSRSRPAGSSRRRPSRPPTAWTRSLCRYQGTSLPTQWRKWIGRDFAGTRPPRSRR